MIKVNPIIFVPLILSAVSFASGIGMLTSSAVGFIAAGLFVPIAIALPLILAHYDILDIRD